MTKTILKCISTSYTSSCEAPVLEIKGTWSHPSLLLLSGSLQPGVIVYVWVLSRIWLALREREREREREKKKFSSTIYLDILEFETAKFNICSTFYLVCNRHHVVLSAQIILTLSRHLFLLSFASGRSSRLYPEISTELLYIGSSRSSWFCLSMWRGSQEYITYEFILTFPAVSHMSGLSNFDSFHTGW